MPTNTSPNRAKAVRAAASAVADSERAPVTEITLKNGVVLGIKPVPSHLVRGATKKLERPKAPTFHNDATGRDEENPLDPTYEAALTDWQQQTFEVGANVLFIAGTWVKELPENIVAPETDEWLDLVEYLQIPVELHCWKCADANPEPDCSGCKKARYLAWLQHYAIESEPDMLRLILAVSGESGISEAEVAEAVETFRSRTQWRADNGTRAEASRNGHHVPEESPQPSP